MTLGMVLTRLQGIRPHEFPESELRAWLWEIEQMIFHEIICPRKGEAQAPEPIDEKTPYERELLAPDPYAQLYLFYLMSQMDIHRAQTERYAFDGALFHAAYLQFAHVYARQHLPVTKGTVRA